MINIVSSIDFKHEVVKNSNKIAKWNSKIKNWEDRNFSVRVFRLCHYSTSEEQNVKSLKITIEKLYFYSFYTFYYNIIYNANWTILLLHNFELIIFMLLLAIEIITKFDFMKFSLSLAFVLSKQIELIKYRKPTLRTASVNVAAPNIYIIVREGASAAHCGNRTDHSILSK